LHIVRTGAALVVVTAIISLIAGDSSRDEAVVPEVVGVDVHSAYGQLRRAGFAIQIDEPIDMSPTSAVSISHQSVAGGNRAAAGGVIVLKVDSHGPGLLPWNTSTLRMPSLVGKPLVEAARTLTRLGLNWGAAPLPALPATTEPTLLHNYEVTAQKPKAGTRFTQTVIRELADGSTLSKTTSAWVAAKLR
jgi:beta-lactam-binding protein with PASTA domain